MFEYYLEIRMKDFVIFLISVTIIATAVSCSEEEQTNENTFEVKATFRFKQTDVWPQHDKIIFGAFGKDTLNPLIYKEISVSEENESSIVTLNRVPEGSTIKVCISNPSNQTLFTFFSYGPLNYSSFVEIPQNEINLLSFSRVQAQVLNNCTACHGGSSGLPAADLNLMPGLSYNNLVDHPSTYSEKMRIVRGNADNSFLIDVLRKRQDIFTHSASNTIEEEDIMLIEHWIEAGAKNN